MTSDITCGRRAAAAFERIRSHLGPLWGLTYLGPSPALALRNAAIALAMPWLQPRLQRRGRLLRVPIRVDGGRRDFFVDSMGDLQVLYEIWCWRIYDVPPLATATTVFDIGANIGAAVAFFKCRRPGVAVHAWEPDPHTFGKLRRNVADLPDVTLHRAAIAADDGEATLFSSPDSWDSSLVAGTSGRIAVRCERLQTARESAGVERIDLLKLDAEGAEFDVLAGAGALAGVDAIVAELHFDLVPGRSLKDVLDACAGFRATVTGDSAARMTMLAVRDGDCPAVAAAHARARRPRR